MYPHTPIYCGVSCFTPYSGKFAFSCSYGIMKLSQGTGHTAPNRRTRPRQFHTLPMIPLSAFWHENTMCRVLWLAWKCLAIGCHCNRGYVGTSAPWKIYKSQVIPMVYKSTCWHTSTAVAWVTGVSPPMKCPLTDTTIPFKCGWQVIPHMERTPYIAE